MLISFASHVAGEILRNRKLHLCHLSSYEGEFFLEGFFGVFSPKGVAHLLTNIFEQSNPFMTEIALYRGADRSIGNIYAVVNVESSPLLVFPDIEFQPIALTLGQPAFESIDDVMSVLCDSPFAPDVVTWQRCSDKEIVVRELIENIASSTGMEQTRDRVLAKAGSSKRLRSTPYDSFS